MSYLKDLPIDVLKIDKSFIDTLNKDSGNCCLVESIINLGHRLGLSITAEGVETEEQFNELKRFDCEYVQGYYFSKPLNVNELKLLLKEKTS